MNIIKIVFGFIIVGMASIFLYALFLPESSTLSRSIVINASQERVFSFTSTHEAFREWSPWSARDPKMDVKYEGPPQGIGSIMHWESEHPEVGKGTSTYTAYKYPSLTTTKLEFDGMGESFATVELEALDSQKTRVTWSFESTHGSLIARYIGLMLDRLVGADYEKGLAALKSLVESQPSIVTEEVQYEVGNVKLTGFIAYPKGVNDAPAVLVVHEWWGHTEYARTRAKMLAELGYSAMALDMYGDGKVASHPNKAKEFMMQALGDPVAVAARFDAAAELLKNHKSSSAEKLAAVGYCFGGSVAMSMARMGKNLDAVVSFHGSLSELSPIQESASSTPILVLNGAADPLVSAESIAEFKREMDDAGMNYDFVNYPDALHAFTNPGATKKGEEFGLPLAYDENVDKQSWEEMKSFLQANL